MITRSDLDEHEKWRQEMIFRAAGHGKAESNETKATPMTSKSADDIIAERAQTHGDFGENARVAQTIRRAMRDTPNWSVLNMEQREALDHIAGKIARAVSSNGRHADHFTDIGGYARLGELATLRRLTS